MLDFSLGEIILVVVVAVIFIGPKELPVVIKALASVMASIRSLMRELTGAFEDLAKESGLKDTADDIKRDIRMIQGDDGQMYESYDMSHLTTPKPKIIDIHPEDEDPDAAPEPSAPIMSGPAHD